MLIFDDYLREQIDGKSKRYSSYCGITRKEYPRWPGWNILRELDCPETDHPILEVLVRNFYYIRYLEQRKGNL